MSSGFLFPDERTRIISALRSGERQDIVIVIIPSHDKNKKELTNQKDWANDALDLLGRLYGGATAFETFGGSYKYKEEILRDKPILAESYADRVDVENDAKLVELLLFAKRMGKATRQAAVGIIINSVFHKITDFKLPSQNHPGGIKHA